MSRRQAIDTLLTGVGAEAYGLVHRGLWLGKYSVSSDAGGIREVIGQAATAQEPHIYDRAFLRWKGALADVGAFGAEIASLGRFVVGIGSESVLENSITLHHTYGVPFIPGSSLKGLASSFAAQWLGPEWARAEEAHRTLFGTTAAEGCVTFHDALPVPGKSELAPDVLTSHHQAYYADRRGTVPPTDWDNPNPVPLVSASGRFVLVLSGPTAWRDAAFKIVELALEHEGIGAKTAVGYGRFRFDGKPALVVKPVHRHVAAFRRELEATRDRELAGRMNALLQTLERPGLSQTQRSEMASALLARCQQVYRREAEMRSRPWYLRLRQLAGED